MRILVCIKQIPENINELDINTSKTNLTIPETMKYRINRFDEHAIEAAISIKEKFSDTLVDIITVGPLSTEGIIKRAMGMGADNGFIVQVDSNTYLSPSTLSSYLATVANLKKYNLILTGIMSEDEMNAQTGQMIAARLKIPSITGVVNIRIIDDKVHIKREREGGIIEDLSVDMINQDQILLTIQAGINSPRYPSLSALLKANSKKIRVFDPVELVSESLKNDQSTIYIKKAEKIRQGKILHGTLEEKAKQFIDIMKERNVLV